MSNKNPEFDYVVVGAGINGTWTAAHLSRRGCNTLLIDQFPLPHSRGSSHGQTRIIRRAYPQKYIREMMDDAYVQWHKHEQEQGVTLIKQIGLLCFSEPDAPFLRDVIKGFKEDGKDSFRVLDHAELKLEYPQIESGGRFIGCLDKEAGIIMADKALLAARKSAMSFGCQVLDDFPVTKIVPLDSNSVMVFGGKEGTKSIRAKGVVVCAGPWTKRLLDPLNFRLPLTTYKIPVFYWKSKSDFIPHTFISFDDGEEVYGFPQCEYPGLLKICAHGGVPAEPDRRDDVDVSAVRNVVKKFISEHFPEVVEAANGPSIEEACMYTVTPDWNHILAKHPSHPNIVVGAGFSGTGFKLAPVTGEILADLAMNLKPKFDLNPFAADRFNNINNKSKL